MGGIPMSMHDCRHQYTVTLHFLRPKRRTVNLWNKTRRLVTIPQSAAFLYTLCLQILLFINLLYFSHFSCMMPAAVTALICGRIAAASTPVFIFLHTPLQHKKSRWMGGNGIPIREISSRICWLLTTQWTHTNHLSVHTHMHKHREQGSGTRTSELGFSWLSKTPEIGRCVCVCVFIVHILIAYLRANDSTITSKGPQSSNLIPSMSGKNCFSSLYFSWHYQNLSEPTK